MNRLVIPVAIFLSLIACETDTTDPAYPRCNPLLTDAVSPESGIAGTEVQLRGNLIIVDNSGLDPYQDILVQFGPNQGTLVNIGEPESIDEDGLACDSCQTCIAITENGCIGCEDACSQCFHTVTVLAPSGQGEVDVQLVNSRGWSNSLRFEYQSTPTQTPATPSPTQPSATPSPSATVSQSPSPTE